MKPKYQMVGSYHCVHEANRFDAGAPPSQAHLGLGLALCRACDRGPAGVHRPERESVGAWHRPSRHPGIVGDGARKDDPSDRREIVGNLAVSPCRAQRINLGRHRWRFW